MNIERAKCVLLRRQAHLLNRVGKHKRKFDYDKEESAAISYVIMELRKLRVEVEEFKKPQVFVNGYNVTDNELTVHPGIKPEEFNNKDGNN